MRIVSQRERRLIAVLILCTVVALLWVTVVGPILSGFSERAARRSVLTRQYQANQRIIGSIPRLRRAAERQRDDLRSFVIMVPTQEAAVAQLQDRLQRTIESAGGEIRAIEDASATGGQVRAHASARMTLGQMAAALARLENESPYLAIEALDISADQAVISGRLDMMEVSFEVSVPVTLAKSR